MAEDADFFVDGLCRGSDPRARGKPVPFVPVIDANLGFWFKKDSLWYSEDARLARDRAALVQPDVMVAPIRWLASDASDEVTDNRFVGRNWDTSLAPDAAALRARAPAAWPDIGTTAAWPGAS